MSFTAYLERTYNLDININILITIIVIIMRQEYLGIQDINDVSLVGNSTYSQKGVASLSCVRELRCDIEHPARIESWRESDHHHHHHHHHHHDNNNNNNNNNNNVTVIFYNFRENTNNIIIICLQFVPDWVKINSWLMNKNKHE